MNKTLLLILLDFLLLHMIHDSPWNKVEKENAHLSGGTDTYAKHAEELQFVRLQMRAKDKETQLLADQLAFSRKGEADKAKNFAEVNAERENLRGELDKTNAAFSETEKQRLIALKDAIEKQKLLDQKAKDLGGIKDELEDRDKKITSLTNTVNNLEGKIGNLTGQIGNLTGQIGDMENNFKTEITNLRNDKEAVITKLRNDKEELNNDNGRLTKENETLTGNLNTAANNMRAANTRIVGLNTELKNTSNNLLVTRQQLQAATGTVGDLKKEKANLTKERDVALTAKTQAETQVKDLVVKVGEERQRTAVATTEARQQQERAVKAEKTVVAATTQAKAAKEERDHVLKQNKVLTDDIKKVAKSADFNTARTLKEVVKAAEAIPQSPNKLFNEFIANRVPLLMQLSRNKAGIIYVNGKPKAAPRQIRKTSQPILVQGEKYLYALLHADQSPFALGPQGNANWEKADGVFLRNEKKVPVHWLGFLKNDPRIVAVPLHKDSQGKNFLNINKTYPLAKRPQDYPEAVIIHNGEEYGVVKFKVDPKLPNYVHVDKPFLGGLFSKRMNPGKGDIVISRTGELLGIMVNSKYCLIIREKELDNVSNSFAKHVVLKDKTHINNLKKNLQNLRSIIQSKPSALH
jgi:hypothetical protein